MRIRRLALMPDVRSSRLSSRAEPGAVMQRKCIYLENEIRGLLPIFGVVLLSDYLGALLMPL